MQRVETRIPGLDEMLDGGLPKGSTTIVVGGSGSGKTTLSLQYLHNGATQYQENGVYISFTETPEMLAQYMGQYGWNLEKLEAEGTLSILRLDPADVMQVIREDYGQIRDTIKANGAKRFVLDPLSTFNIIVKDPFDRKMSLLKFCEWLRKNDCTSLMTVESERVPASASGAGFEEYVSDGVIVLYNLQMRNVRQNAIEVLKMRGSQHSRKIVPFIFDKGIRVSPEEKLFWQAER
jgi:KaiC/GvpD/RAD55 family RecA-like ATPase